MVEGEGGLFFEDVGGGLFWVLGEFVVGVEVGYG